MPEAQSRDIDLEEFLSGSLEGLKLATAAHSDAWGFDRIKHWNLDQDTGILQFTLEEGIAAFAQAQIVGTYDAKAGTFMWGWEHPSVDPALQEDASLARAFGERHGFAELTTQVVACDQDRAWGYTALAMRLAKANGAYRAPANETTFVFLTFSKIQLRKLL